MKKWGSMRTYFAGLGLFLALNNAVFAGDKAAFQLEEATIDSVHQAIKAHQLNCEQLVTTYLNRIKQYDLSVKTRPPINAITEINPSALDEARALDRSYEKTQQWIGPLHCVPVILKDNMNAFDGTMTSGSFSLLGTQPIEDAFIVEKMRKAGAIILARGTMDEFAFNMFGISSRNGRTGNPYDTTKNPGGSSGGSAAAVSANFALVGLGTDNSGSVRIPAAFNGLSGLRPSTGLLSQRGIYPMGNLDGVPGPLTRTVRDLAIVMDVIAQKDSRDPKTVEVPRVASYTAFLKADGMRGKRIGIVHRVDKIDTFKEMPNDVKNTLQNLTKKFQDLGAEVIDNIELEKFDNDRKDNMSGTIEDVNAYLKSFPATRKNFVDICQSNRTRTFGDEKKCMKFMRKLAAKNSVKYEATLKKFSKNREYVEKIMQEKHLDALLMPLSREGIAVYDPMKIDTWQASVSSNSGLPSIVINAGYLHEMPVGVELIGKQFDEAKLIEMAYGYEQHSDSRLLPTMPEVNANLETFSIPEFNNLLTQIGSDTYENVLKKASPNEDAYKELTPQVFKQIVVDRLP
jgi:amidase